MMNQEILGGLRVLDFTWMLAGPYATRILADFGAEVIKVQSKKTARGAESNTTGYFSTWNRNKRSITLDMSYPEAKKIVLSLVKISDVVVENFSPRVMSNWGLNYGTLEQVRPHLIMISMSAMGQTGPWEDDPNVLYVCLCGSPSLEKNNKINIQVPPKVLDEEYLELIRIGLLPRTKSFQPDLLFWNWGYDGTRGEYGDIGLTPDLHISLAKELKALANEISNGRLIIVLCGGSRRDLAHQLIPQIIRVLIENESASPKNHLSHDRLCDT